MTTEEQDVLEILEVLAGRRCQNDSSLLAGAGGEAGPHTRDGSRGGLEQLLPVVLEDQAALHLGDDLAGDIRGEVTLLLGLENDGEVVSVGRHLDKLQNGLDGVETG